MQSLVDALVSIYAYLALFPFIPFLIIWVLLILILRDRVVATRIAIDFTTFLLLGANAALINLHFTTDIGIWIILAALLLTFGLLGSLQSRKRGKSNLSKLTFKIWRSSFILFSLSYFIFMFIRVGQLMIYQ